MRIVQIGDYIPMNRRYLLRMMDSIYETKLLLEVESKQNYNAVQKMFDPEDSSFTDSPYSSVLNTENYSDDDMFILFEVISVVENKNVPLDLLDHESFSDLDETQKEILEETLGFIYTESQYNSLQEAISDGKDVTDTDFRYKNIDKQGELMWVRIIDEHLTILEKHTSHFIFNDKMLLKYSIREYLSNPSDSPHISQWDVSNVKDMSFLFGDFIDREGYNELLIGIEDWNVSKVTNMEGMFSDCIFFNQPLNKWNVSSVKNMKSMFSDCRYFNQPLNKWNVSSVENMKSMFYSCFTFNQPLNDWELPIIESMDQMFHYCRSFDQDLNSWNIPPAVSKTKMFDGTLMKKRNHLPAWYDLDCTESEYIIPFASIAEYSPEDFELHNEEVSSFLSTFVDYMPFIEFINSFLPEFSPNEYTAYYSKMSPLYFILSPPAEYRITERNIPVEVLRTDPREPFYNALRYIFKIIPHFSPSSEVDPRNTKSTSEHSYMVHINRLIYYYHLFHLFNLSELKGFENTGCVIIFTHGTHDNPKDTRTLDEPTANNKLENIFVCSKAAMGCIAYDSDAHLVDSAKDGNLLDEMCESIKRFSSIPFDEIIFNYYGSQDTKKISGNCRTNEYIFGGPMQHKIGPNNKGFINKTYTGSVEDSTIYIIDVETFCNVKEIHRNPMKRLTESNILLKPELNVKNLKIKNGKIIDFDVELSDIVNYYSKVLRKKNLFVYDRSCGSFKSEDYPEEPISFHQAVGDIDTKLVKGHPSLIPFERHLSNITEELRSQGWGKKKSVTKKRKLNTKRKTKKHKKKQNKSVTKRRRRSSKNN
jgi:surface protein